MNSFQRNGQGKDILDDPAICGTVLVALLILNTQIPSMGKPFPLQIVASFDGKLVLPWDSNSVQFVR